jgi:hypothetical protein
LTHCVTCTTRWRSLRRWSLSTLGIKCHGLRTRWGRATSLCLAWVEKWTRRRETRSWVSSEPGIAESWSPRIFGAEVLNNDLMIRRPWCSISIVGDKLRLAVDSWAVHPPHRSIRPVWAQRSGHQLREAGGREDPPRYRAILRDLNRWNAHERIRTSMNKHHHYQNIDFYLNYISRKYHLLPPLALLLIALLGHLVILHLPQLLAPLLTI